MANTMRNAKEAIALLASADRTEFEYLRRALEGDDRKTIQAAIARAARRLDAEDAERERVAALFAFDREQAGEGLCLGIDEVGRGPLAGPLTVAGVVWGEEALIEGLNDSKRVPEARREGIAQRIREQARAFAIVHRSPRQIDELGMSACLHSAFSEVIERIDGSCPGVGTVLIDGIAQHLDPRERNVVKGDGKSAAIAAASLIAKVERDRIMREEDGRHPGYGFASNKGYGSAEHCEAIARLGLSPLHRASFCQGIIQPTLF